MLKKVIAGWSAAPDVPKGWDPERDGDCGALSIRIVSRPDGIVDFVESTWEPTRKELVRP
jgi:hypothetical protein